MRQAAALPSERARFFVQGQRPRLIVGVTRERGCRVARAGFLPSRGQRGLPLPLAWAAFLAPSTDCGSSLTTGDATVRREHRFQTRSGQQRSGDHPQLSRASAALRARGAPTCPSDAAALGARRLLRCLSLSISLTRSPPPPLSRRVPALLRRQALLHALNGVTLSLSCGGLEVGCLLWSCAQRLLHSMQLAWRFVFALPSDTTRTPALGEKHTWQLRLNLKNKQERASCGQTSVFLFSPDIRRFNLVLP